MLDLLEPGVAGLFCAATIGPQEVKK